LNLPRRVGAANGPERRTSCGGGRRREIGLVENIEEFAAELQPDALSYVERLVDTSVGTSAVSNCPKSAAASSSEHTNSLAGTVLFIRFYHPRTRSSQMNISDS
jgi:hypothetical protein